MDIASTLSDIGAGVIEARKRAGVKEEIREDGQPYCTKCGEPLLLELKFSGAIAETLGTSRYVPRNCECMRIMFDIEDAAHQAEVRARELEGKRIDSLRSEKYRKSTFAKDDGRAPNIRKTCEQYVENREEMLHENLGLAFLGGNGGGKTFWASCIANALIDAGASVIMTTLPKLIADMNADYGDQKETILRKIKTVQFLILDDYGAERGTEFSLEQAFRIIDARYNAEKPLIITANLTEEALKNPTNMNYGRSYSRIVEMCPAMIRVQGERRNAIAAEKRKRLAEILRGE